MKYRNHYIIHAFAVLHFLVALFCRYVEWNDDYVVTYLTTSMVFMLSIFSNRSSAEGAMLSLIYLCVGYYVGSQVPTMLFAATPHIPMYCFNAFTTFVLTEVFGWLTVLIFGNPKPKSIQFKVSKSNIRPLALLFLVVLLYRIIYVDLVAWASGNTSTTLYKEFIDYGSRPFVVLFSLVGSFFMMRFVCKRYPYAQNPVAHFFWIMMISLFIALLSTLFIEWEKLPQVSGLAKSCELIIFYSAANVTNLFANIVFSLIISYMLMSRQLVQEVGQRHQAQYQYHQLKQQLNPHFLFNCLNILDYIVQSGEQDHASRFIRKLAGVYRYQLSMADMRKVSLAEELKHVTAYVELLQERFGQAFQTQVDVPADYMELDIVPCSIQLMVENAQKHNMVNQDNPLLVHIYVEDLYICVSNNIQERRSKPDSTGIGLQNIKQQYADLTPTPVVVLNDGKQFLVKLPLL